MSNGVALEFGSLAVPEELRLFHSFLLSLEADYIIPKFPGA